VASEQWLLNDTSVASGSFWTAVGSSYKIKNNTTATLNRTTSSPSPYEGAGCYTGANDSIYPMRYQTSASADLTGAFYEDYFFYRTSADLVISSVCFNDTATQYSYVIFGTDNKFNIVTYDGTLGETYRSTSSAVVPSSAWFRVQVKRTSVAISEVKLFKDSNINGTTADATITWTPTYSNYEYTTTGAITKGWIDNLRIDSAAYPVRSFTADASSTITATGTATMSNARVVAGSATVTASGTSTVTKNQPLDASATVTASGTSAANNARVLDASATVTASGTSAISNARVLDASATVTASGTSAASNARTLDASSTVTASGTSTASIAAVITMDASSTITASATSNAASTQLINASATITGTGESTASIRPIVTIDASSTVTASATSTLSRGQSLSGSATATASAASTIIGVITISGNATVTASASAAVLVLTKGSLYSEVKTSASLYGKQSSTLLTN
jgi:hypothetical protein